MARRFFGRCLRAFAHYTARIDRGSSSAYDLAMPPPQPAKKRVLVVDDDRTLQLALIRLLDAAGFTAAAASNGATALAEICSRTFDLIVLDLGLPEVSGLDVLAEIQKLQSPPKVIIVTADDTPATVLQAIRDRAYQYIVKPTPPKIIVELVERVLTSSSARPIEVVPARSEWLELLVAWDLESGERIPALMHTRYACLPGDCWV